MMKGYWNRPDPTAEVIDADGWITTGDMARVDEDGYFFIVDLRTRSKPARILAFWQAHTLRRR